ncbi:hypothetical protein CsSME_00022695 [Camellia sinensis var. sinensis]
MKRRHMPYLLSLLMKHITSREAIRQIHAQLIFNGIHSTGVSMTIWNYLFRHYSLEPPTSAPTHYLLRQLFLLFSHQGLHQFGTTHFGYSGPWPHCQSRL